MIDAANDGDKDSYAALAKFMKAYKLFYKSLKWAISLTVML